MFKNLLEFWKGKDFLTEVLADFNSMLDDATKMFAASYAKLIHGDAKSVHEQEVYDLDQRINKKQKEIRQRIIEHLSVNPSVDVMAGLLLFSVSKDAERLGDFAKNIYENSVLLQKPFDNKRYGDLFGDMEKNITELFELTKSAFIESDEEKAKSAWEYQRTVKRKCDEIIYRVSRNDSGFDVNEAVCIALTARYMRRIASHLTNIATSVIVPLTDLDYYHDKREVE